MLIFTSKAVVERRGFRPKFSMTGRLEIDFLVFHKGKCISLEIDGKHHQENGQTHRDYIRDRLLLREGIATARFTAQECMESPDAAIEEFLNLF